MNKTVVINLGHGDLRQGCPHITARLWTDQHPGAEQFVGNLPAAPEIAACYISWRSTYLALCNRLVIRSPLDEELEIEEGGVTQVSQVSFQEFSQQLKQQINQWLRSNSFLNIERQLRSQLSPSEEIRVIFEAENDLTRRLPWHCWDFFRDYPKAEMALSRAEYKRRDFSQLQAPRKKVRILAILGNCQNIDVELERQFLQRLREAETTFLVMPSRQEFNQQLWHPSGWDILFFAGHSQTQGETGRIYINENPINNSLTIEQLEDALNTAIDKGLKLAIFNSCDGVGLAQALAKLHIPQVIVMREPVPNRVAQEFLRCFLEAFAVEELSLYLAVRQARQQLQGLEDDFPGASWLPVIWQNPAEVSPTWQKLLGRPRSSIGLKDTVAIPTQPRKARHQSSVKRRQLFLIPLLTSMVMTGLMIGGRSLSWLQPAELWAYDQFMRQQVHPDLDSRLLVVGINDTDVKQHGQPLRDRTVYQLLKKLEQYQPKVVGLDIFRDQPQGEGWQDLTRFLQTSNRVVTICQDASDRQIPIAAPPKMSQDRISYADALIHDANDVIRRYVLAQTVKGESSCSASDSFAFQLVRRFLPENMPYKLQPGIGASINHTPLEIIQPNSGGYQLSSQETLGYQLLIDYRPNPIARIASLTDILNAQAADLQNLIRDRIILIGYINESTEDKHLTPIGNQPGIMIHAYLVSQVLRAVIDQEPLLSPWSKPLEELWIFTWAAIASMLICKSQSKQVRVFLVGAILIVLLGSSLILFQKSIWVPVVPTVLVVLTSSCVALYLTAYLQPESP